MVGHTFEHLEAEAVLRRLIHLGEQVSIRDGKEIMRSHTDMEHLCVFRLQSALDDMQVVGVHLGLVAPDGIRPPTQVTHDILHVEVTSLHDTHLDGRSSRLHTLTGKLEQLRLEVPGIRQIGLHHDTRLVVLELRQGEHVLEEFHRQVGILVFLHIKVDELGALLSVGRRIGVVDSCLIESRHTTDELRERLLIVQGMGLGIDAGYLHADIVDVGLLQGF